MEGPWSVHGLSMDPPWPLHGLSMDCAWTRHGPTMDRHGQPPRIATGNLELPWTLQELPWATMDNNE